MDVLISNTASNLIPNWVVSLYDHIMSADDPRTRDWPLIISPTTPFSFVFTYVLVVWAGPKLMQNRKPIDLGHLLTIYNFSLVGLSAYMAYEFFMSAFLANYSLGCQPVDYSNSPLALRMARVCWVYYFSKYIEILDTIVFILRKKNNQLSFLHVYHHGTMLLIWWQIVRFIPGGPSFFHGLFNSCVHVVMYSYYGWCSLGSSMQPPLWCKKIVTKLQITQFLVVLVHCTYVTTRCDFPLIHSIMATCYAVTMIVLFANFYFQQYLRRSKGKSTPTTKPDRSLSGNDNDNEAVVDGESRSGHPALSQDGDAIETSSRSSAAAASLALSNGGKKDA